MMDAEPREVAAIPLDLDAIKKQIRDNTWSGIVSSRLAREAIDTLVAELERSRTTEQELREVLTHSMELLVQALPLVQCPNEPCACGRDALHDEAWLAIQSAREVLGANGGMVEVGRVLVRERIVRSALVNLLNALEQSPAWPDWSSAPEVHEAQSAIIRTPISPLMSGGES